jgi:hypothetical protein
MKTLHIFRKLKHPTSKLENHFIPYLNWVKFPDTNTITFPVSTVYVNERSLIEMLVWNIPEETKITTEYL